MQFPTSIGLRRSLLLLFLLVLLHGVATAALIAVPWPPLSLRCVLLALVGASLAHALRPPRIVGLRFAAPDRLDCLLADGQHVAAKALPDSAVFSRLVVLRVRLGEEKRVSNLVVLPDQMPAEQFRVLRLWLRWHAEPKNDVGTAS